MKHFHRYTALAVCLALCQCILLTAGCAVPEEAPVSAPKQTRPAPAEDPAENREEVPPMDAENRIWNIQDFGAVGTGRVDDYTALQRAINTVLRAGGGTVYFPAGTYSISRSLRVTMEGDVPITLKSDPAAGAVISGTSELEGATLYVNHPYVTLDGVSVSQNAVGNEPAVLLLSDHALLTGCTLSTVEGNTSPILKVYGSYNTVKAVGFGYAASTPHIVEFSKQKGITAFGNILEDCYFGGSHTQCVLVTSEESTGCQEGLIIRRNVFLLPAVGQVEIRAARDCSVNDNMLDAGNVNILLTPMEAGIDGLAITNNYCGASAGGLHTDESKGGSIRNLIVSANYFWNPDCIRLAVGRQEQIRLLDNYFVKTDGTAVYMSDASGAMLEGNVLTSLGGEYGLVIGKVDGNTVIQYNDLGKADVPEWDSRFGSLN